MRSAFIFVSVASAGYRLWYSLSKSIVDAEARRYTESAHDLTPFTHLRPARLTQTLFGTVFVLSILLLAAAELRSVGSVECLLGNLYLHGRVVEQDYGASIYWYRLAAKHGSRRAMYGLGYIYESGRGTPREPHQAVYWYTLAAAEGELAAQLSLADIYEHGRYWGCESQTPLSFSWCDGIGVNVSQAAYWYRQASRLGSSCAQKKLIELGAKNGGIEEDPLVRTGTFSR